MNIEERKIKTTYSQIQSLSNIYIFDIYILYICIYDIVSTVLNLFKNSTLNHKNFSMSLQTFCKYSFNCSLVQ